MMSSITAPMPKWCQASQPWLHWQQIWTAVRHHSLVTNRKRVLVNVKRLTLQSDTSLGYRLVSSSADEYKNEVSQRLERAMSFRSRATIVLMQSTVLNVESMMETEGNSCITGNCVVRLISLSCHFAAYSISPAKPVHWGKIKHQCVKADFRFRLYSIHLFTSQAWPHTHGPCCSNKSKHD